MGEPDLVIQIQSNMRELNCNFFIDGRNTDTTSNVISEAMEYWRKYKISLSEKIGISRIFSFRLRAAKITSINVIELTPK